MQGTEKSLLGLRQSEQGLGRVGWVEWVKLSQRVSGPRLKDLSFYTKGNGEPLVALGLVFI